MCGYSLTEHSDVNTGRGRLVLDAFVDMAGVGSAVGKRGAREDEAGAHGRTR